MAKLAEDKTELNQHKVELGKVEELSALLKKAKAVESDMVNAFVEARAISKKGIEAGEKHLQNRKEIYNLTEDIRTSAGELGIDPNSITEWKSAYNFLTQNPESATNKMIQRMKGLL